MKNYDVITVGGGFAGVAAAIAAAREGANVLLVERNCMLGGAASNCLINPFMRSYTTVQTKNSTCEVPLNKGIFALLLARLKQMGGLKRDTSFIAKDYVFNEEYVKFIFENMCKENGVNLLYKTVMTDVNVDDGFVKSIRVFNKSGFSDLSANFYIDATGDADLAYAAGAECKLGRDGDEMCQPMTLCFRLCNVDMEAYRREKSSINPLYNKFRAQGKIKNPRENVLIFDHFADGILHFNTTRAVKLNPVNAEDITKAQIETREQVFEMFYFLRENFSAFKNAELLMTAPEVGVRESRKIVGEYTLTKDDIIGCKHFLDSIAVGAYEIDIHSPDGTGTELVYLKPDQYYTIPYRSLIPKTLKNVLVAGRCISATQEAQSSIRIMPVVCNIGEGAGVAIGKCVGHGCKDVRDVNVLETQVALRARGGRHF